MQVEWKPLKIINEASKNETGREVWGGGGGGGGNSNEEQKEKEEREQQQETGEEEKETVIAEMWMQIYGQQRNRSD